MAYRIPRKPQQYYQHIGAVDENCVCRNRIWEKLNNSNSNSNNYHNNNNNNIGPRRRCRLKTMMLNLTLMMMMVRLMFLISCVQLLWSPVLAEIDSSAGSISDHNTWSKAVGTVMTNSNKSAASDKAAAVDDDDDNGRDSDALNTQTEVVEMLHQRTMRHQEHYKQRIEQAVNDFKRLRVEGPVPPTPKTLDSFSHRQRHNRKHYDTIKTGQPMLQHLRHEEQYLRLQQKQHYKPKQQPVELLNRHTLPRLRHENRHHHVPRSMPQMRHQYHRHQQKQHKNMTTPTTTSRQLIGNELDVGAAQGIEQKLNHNTDHETGVGVIDGDTVSRDDESMIQPMQRYTNNRQRYFDRDSLYSRPITSTGGGWQHLRHQYQHQLKEQNMNLENDSNNIQRRYSFPLTMADESEDSEDEADEKDVTDSNVIKSDGRKFYDKINNNNNKDDEHDDDGNVDDDEDDGDDGDDGDDYYVYEDSNDGAKSHTQQPHMNKSIKSYGQQKNNSNSNSNSNNNNNNKFPVKRYTNPLKSLYRPTLQQRGGGGGGIFRSQLSNTYNTNTNTNTNTNPSVGLHSLPDNYDENNNNNNNNSGDSEESSKDEGDDSADGYVDTHDDNEFSNEKWNKIEHEHYRKQLQHQHDMEALRSRHASNNNNNNINVINSKQYPGTDKRQILDNDDAANIYSRYYTPGSVTRTKQEELGSPSAVLEARRAHALTQRQNKALANAHHRRVVGEVACRRPQPRVERVRRDPWKIYTPHCTILHRCADDTGCCPSERQTCAPKHTKNVDLYFFVISLNETQGSIERLTFINHTECYCVEKSKQQAPEYAVEQRHGWGSSSDKTEPLIPNQLPYLRRTNILDCNCPNLFEKILQEDGYCRCDCSSGNTGCDWLKRGMEHFSMNDRKCILEDRCKLPTCEYGVYIKKHGRCPRREERQMSGDINW